MGQIYKITITKPSGEKFNYIGKSSHTSEIRFKGHQNGDQLVDRYIKKYLDSTVLTTLVTGIQTEEELNDFECYYIQKFESYKPWGKNGLNLTLGGDGARKYNISKDELQAAVDEGLSRIELCVRFGGISLQGLVRWMKAYEIGLKTVCELNRVKLEALTAEGKTLTEMSQITGINNVQISEFLRENGLKAATKKKALTTDEQVGEIRELTEAGKSVREIERLTGIHRATVHANQKRLGIKSTNKGGGESRIGSITVTPELISKVSELRASGLSYDSIARELNCSSKTVNRILAGNFDHLK